MRVGASLWPNCWAEYLPTMIFSCFSSWARSPESVAAAFGIPAAELHEISRTGWVCGDCGCVFLGRVEAGVAYPDRFAPIGRAGPCDAQEDCSCHDAPLQRRIR